MKRILSIIVVLFSCGCSTDSHRDSLEVIENLNQNCLQQRVDTIGSNIVTIYIGNDCKIIQRVEQNKYDSDESFYYNLDGKLTLKLIETDTSKYYCLPDIFKENDFYHSYYSGEAIYDEYMVSYDRDSKRVDLCELVSESDPVRFNNEILDYIDEYYDYSLTTNELLNLHFYLYEHCFNNPM